MRNKWILPRPCPKNRREAPTCSPHLQVDLGRIGEVMRRRGVELMPAELCAGGLSQAAETTTTSSRSREDVRCLKSVDRRRCHVDRHPPSLLVGAPRRCSDGLKGGRVVPREYPSTSEPTSINCVVVRSLAPSCLSNTNSSVEILVEGLVN